MRKMKIVFFLQHRQNEKNQEVKEFNGKNQDFDEGNYVKTAWFQRKTIRLENCFITLDKDGDY